MCNELIFDHVYVDRVVSTWICCTFSLSAIALRSKSATQNQQLLIVSNNPRSVFVGDIDTSVETAPSVTALSVGLQPKSPSLRGLTVVPGLESPRSICVDYSHPNRFYVGDSPTIRTIEHDVVSTLIGGTEMGFNDGHGSDVRLYVAHGMVLTQECDTLIFADYGNNRIRSVDLKTRVTKTIAGDGILADLTHPRSIVWSRHPTHGPFKVLFILAAGQIHRMNMDTCTLR